VYRNEDVNDRPHATDARNAARCLTQFVSCHRACGRLTGDATEPEASGYMVTVNCSCRVSSQSTIRTPNAMVSVVTQ
jgi:hypothetical protein